jgi:hypothetical protein
MSGSNIIVNYENRWGLLPIEQIGKITLEIDNTSPYGGKLKLKGVLTLDKNKLEGGKSLLDCLEIQRNDGSIVAQTPNLVQNIQDYREMRSYQVG